MTLEADHPLSRVLEFCRNEHRVRFLEVSVYSYRPQTVPDPRRVLKIPVDKIEAWFVQNTSELAREEEIALHSRVYVRNLFRTHTFHLPMVDFKGEVEPDRLSRCRQILGEFQCDNSALFWSGRSYHLYGFKLMEALDWVRFMGRILLLNEPGSDEMVDSRWVGHRLLAGYGALRCTRNTHFYQAIPSLVSLPRAETTSDKANKEKHDLLAARTAVSVDSSALAAASQ